MRVSRSSSEKISASNSTGKLCRVMHCVPRTSPTSSTADECALAIDSKKSDKYGLGKTTMSPCVTIGSCVRFAWRRGHLSYSASDLEKNTSEHTRTTVIRL